MPFYWEKEAAEGEPVTITGYSSDDHPPALLKEMMSSNCELLGAYTPAEGEDPEVRSCWIRHIDLFFEDLDPPGVTMLVDTNPEHKESEVTFTIGSHKYYYPIIGVKTMKKEYIDGLEDEDEDEVASRFGFKTVPIEVDYSNPASMYDWHLRTEKLPLINPEAPYLEVNEQPQFFSVLRSMLHRPSYPQLAREFVDDHSVAVNGWNMPVEVLGALISYCHLVLANRDRLINLPPFDFDFDIREVVPMLSAIELSVHYTAVEDGLDERGTPTDLIRGGCDRVSFYLFSDVEGCVDEDVFGPVLSFPALQYLFGTPVAVELCMEQLEGITDTDDDNSFVTGGSGAGKSFFMNEMMGAIDHTTFEYMVERTIKEYIDDLEEQIGARIRDTLGRDPVVEFAAFDDADDSISTNRLDQIAVESDRAVIVATHNPSWGEGKDFRSKELSNPTWLEIACVADEQIRTTGDFQHVFLEGIDYLETVEGIDLYHLALGS